VAPLPLQPKEDKRLNLFAALLCLGSGITMGALHVPEGVFLLIFIVLVIWAECTGGK
jgi:hypothetical protein